jgi:hypothetical protein
LTFCSAPAGTSIQRRGILGAVPAAAGGRGKDTGRGGPIGAGGPSTGRARHDTARRGSESESEEGSFEEGDETDVDGTQGRSGGSDEEGGQSDNQGGASDGTTTAGSTPRGKKLPGSPVKRGSPGKRGGSTTRQSSPSQRTASSCVYVKEDECGCIAPRAALKGCEFCGRKFHVECMLNKFKVPCCIA